MLYFREMIVDYLDSYQPELFLSLEGSGRLDWYVEIELERLYRTIDQITFDLRSQCPDMSSAQVSLEAERAAVELVLEFDA